MKKLFLIFVLMSIGIFAQSSGYQIGKGVIFSDSLKSYSASYASDSSKIYKVDYEWSFGGVVVKDSGTTYTDSIKLYQGTIRYRNSFSGVAVDTIWSSEALPVKNNGWNVDTVLVGAGKNKFYTILAGNVRLLKIKNVNAQIIAGRKTDIVVEAKKD